MNWIPLESEAGLQSLVEKSNEKPQVIFKHSTRCSISSMAKNRLEKSEEPENIDFHFLDLIKFRSLSNQIADDFGIKHESPQVILIQNAKPVYHTSHSAIFMDEIVENVG